MKIFYFLLLCSFFAGTTTMFGQNQTMRFVYIDHEADTPINILCNHLKGFRDDIQEVGEDDKMIVYLSTGLQERNYGMLSLTNLKDKSGKDYDTDNAFNNIIAALQSSNSHSIEAKEDVRNIIRLFNEYGIIDSEGKSDFSEIILDFYVGPNFWLLGNNHRIIAHLYSCLGIYNLPPGKCTINVRYPKGITLKYNANQPFGTLNLHGINESKFVKLIKY